MKYTIPKVIFIEPPAQGSEFRFRKFKVKVAKVTPVLVGSRPNVNIVHLEVSKKGRKYLQEISWETVLNAMRKIKKKNSHPLTKVFL